MKRRYATAVRFYREAFALKPELQEQLDARHRYQAALAAVQAGCGQGEDSAKLSDEEREALRRQALEWLQADLRRWVNAISEKQPPEPSQAHRFLVVYWQSNARLAAARDAEALARLPVPEQQAWGQLWRDVATLVEKSANP
jgi:hypothetical protein